MHYQEVFMGTKIQRLVETDATLTLHYNYQAVFPLHAVA